uniref:uncharacterized protein LOC101310013 n=1 Tax=Fragaria vesca subsp. vesca TaxID=101020 RepID=UPI0005C952A3|nr:PREDICTED: uncharacterized protein LOC101310013 [Fragaria vesca subsp. vesca]
MMNLPEDLKVKYCLEVVGSCNGLLCLNDLGRRFYISNPITVLLIYTIQGSDVGEVMVLSLGSSGLWRSVGSSVYPKRESQPYMTHLNGRLHWSVKSNGSLLICSFDLETEKLQESPPFSMEQANSKFVTLGVLGGCLCLMGWNGDNVSCSTWVMKDYGGGVLDERV